MFDNIHGIEAIYQGPRQRRQRHSAAKHGKKQRTGMGMMVRWCDEVEEKTKRNGKQLRMVMNVDLEQIKHWRKRPKTERAGDEDAAGKTEKESGSPQHTCCR